MLEKKYEPVGKCIYCGATRHSGKRHTLGDEHIIPEGLGGKLVLPKASCERHEKITNASEQFCQKNMLGAFRYKMGLPTKRPKDRPTTLPVEVNVDGKIEVRQIPIAEYPIHIFIPEFPLPEIILPSPLRKSNLLKFHTYPDSPAWENDQTQVLGSESGHWIKARINFQDAVVHSGSTDTDKFSRMLAKIAHAYTTAELGYGKFHPLLLPAIEENKNYPIHHLVGGENERPPAGEGRHEISLSLDRHHNRDFWIVRIRLFCDLGFPEYICVSGLAIHERPRLLRKMLEATPLAIETFTRFDIGKNPGMCGSGSTEFLCANCEDIVCLGVVISDGVTIRCAKCKTWNVHALDNNRWRVPYNQTDFEAPSEMFPRAKWINSSNSTKS